MSDHREPARRATAALVAMVAKAKEIQSAVIADASPAEVEAMRQDALALGEAYLDQNIKAAQATRAILDS